MNPDDDPLSRRRFVLATATAVAAAGASGTALGQEDDEDGEDENGDEEDEENGEDEEENGDEEDEENGEEDDGDDAGGAVETVDVGDNYYEPEDLSIEPGTTVEWVWVGDVDHNVNPTDQPGDADWEGHPDLQADGEYEHTFDVEGDYAYTCDPHPGMDGTITVDPDADAAADGPIQLVPDAAWTLVIATVAGMVSTLSLVYAFMRYGGSNPEQ